MSGTKTSLEVIAPSVEEAIEKGAAELGISPEMLEVEILDDGGKSFLGIGGRQARVRLTISFPQDKDEPEVEKAPKQPEIEAPATVADPAPVDSEFEQIALVATDAVVGELIQRMGFVAEIDVRWGEKEEGSRIRPLLVNLHGDDLSLLIGRRGETLSALQYITRLIVAKEASQPVAVVIDVEGYRSRREMQLRKLARRMADQAIELQKTMALEPMPPNERRIIHIELRDDPAVSTESIGERDRRKVTIIPTPAETSDQSSKTYD
jgi:spoIIIJ-associated protein